MNDALRYTRPQKFDGLVLAPGRPGVQTLCAGEFCIWLGPRKGMTMEGQEVDAGEDETRDYLVEAGAIARGEDPGVSWHAPIESAHVRELVDVLGGELTMARDTFADMERVQKAIGRDTMAEACRIAKEHINGVLARIEP